jgi:phosphoglycolate phosphatase
VCAVGVAWGMHTERQLTEAGAERVALWPQELLAWLRGADQNAVACACDPSGADPQIETGRLRRERQLQTRQTQSAALTSTGTGTSASTSTSADPICRHTPDVTQSELLQALRRIVGGRP